MALLKLVTILALTASALAASVPETNTTESAPSTVSSAAEINLDMGCHKTGGPKEQRPIGQPDGKATTEEAFPLPKHHIEMRSVKDNDTSSASDESAGSSESVESTEAPANVTGEIDIETEGEEFVYKGSGLDRGICDIANNSTIIDLDYAPAAAKYDPMNFTIAGYPCWLTGFSDIIAQHSNCTNKTEKVIFYGHFVWKNITAECDCGHAMTDFRWMVSVQITNTSLHARIHKHKNGKYMYFYDTETYSHYSEVDAPIGKAHQIQNFLELFHHQLRTHFEMAYVDVSNILLKVISARF